MLGRTFACAIVMIGIATPALAGERSAVPAIHLAAAPDTLRLLLEDDRVTSGMHLALIETVARFDVGVHSASPGPSDRSLVAFEALDVPAAAYLRGLEGSVDASRFTLTAPQPGFTGWPLPSFDKNSVAYDARDAIREVMANGARPPRIRGRTPLDTMLTFSLDGQDKSPVLSMGGPASVLNLLQAR